MDEAQVKAGVLMLVRATAKRQAKPLVTLEFTLGNSGVRADLAVFAHLATGFEIKTARDSLRRLPMQMEAYSRYFDKTVAIIAPRHLDKLNVEDLCGAALWTYDDFGRLTVLSHGVQTFVDLSHRQDVLTKAEFERMDFSQAIEARYGATSRRFWSATARRSIRSTDLPLLSRFSEARAAARELTAAREARWAEWLAAQAPHVAALA